jgi:co-chaperonin GroES (HSP10)
MAIKVPSGKLLLKLDPEARSDGGSTGTVIAVGPAANGPIGLDMAIAAKVGDKVHFSLGDTMQNVSLDGEFRKEPHVVISDYQVNVIETSNAKK